MFFTAYETKGYTLEEMDDVFDSSVPAWRTNVVKSRLKELERNIQEGTVKIVTPEPRTTEVEIV